MNKLKLIVVSFFVIFSIFSSFSLFATTSTTEEKEVQKKEVQGEAASLKYLSAAIAVGIACISGGFAVGKIGAAAMGAMSEKPEVSGKAIPFVGLAEGICLWGFLVALLIILL